MIAQFLFWHALQVVQNSLDEEFSFLEIRILIQLVKHLLNGIMQKLLVWFIVIVIVENLLQSWVLFKIFLDCLLGCESVTSHEIVSKGYRNFRLMVWIFVFVGEFNMEFFGQGLVGVSLNAQCRAHR